MSIQKLLNHINVAKHLSNHIIGEHHTPGHRKTFGAIIMMIGVLIVKLTLMFDAWILHFLGDVIGFAIHGVGLIPFVNDVEKPKKEQQKETTKCETC